MNHGLLRPAGIVIATDFEGREVQRDTNQCVHCGAHWIVVKGSGRPHVFCRRCGGNTCSNRRCLRECSPAEKKLDEAERRAQLILPS